MNRETGTSFENAIKRRENEEREEGRADQASDHNSSKRLLNFATRSCSEKHRDETEGGHGSRD